MWECVGTESPVVVPRVSLEVFRRESLIESIFDIRILEVKKKEGTPGALFHCLTNCPSRNKSHKNWKENIGTVSGTTLHKTIPSGCQSQNCSILAVYFSSSYMRIDIIMNRIGYRAGQF